MKVRTARAWLTCATWAVLAGTACEPSNVLRPVSRADAVNACIAFASCLPTDGIHRCFDYYLPLLQPEETRCLAAAGADCTKVGRCVGQRVSAAPDGCPTMCEGGELATCRDGLRVRVDCKRWSAVDAVCVQGPQSALMPGAACGIGTCDRVTQRCDGTVRIACDPGSLVLTSEDCRAHGALTCRVEGGVAQCAGTGAACAEEGASRCEGDVRLRCIGGREERRDCRIGLQGGGCRSAAGPSGAYAFCGFDTECRPKSGDEACGGEGGTFLTFCAGGAREVIDCSRLGYRGCAGRACAGRLP